MTTHHDSEKELFDSDEEPKQRTPPQAKRDSFGPRLPVFTKAQSLHLRNMSGSEGNVPGVGKGKDKGKDVPPRGTGKGEGTMLGLPGFLPEEQGSLVFVGKDAKGEVMKINLFENVFSDGATGSKKLESFLNYVNAVGKLEFAGFIDGITYQGFDREFYIRSALMKVSVSVFCRFAILGAVRGSNFKKIVDSCLTMPQDLITLHNSGVVIKTAKRRDDLTILRFTASIPHWVAFWLFKVNMAKKLDQLACPGWLQFPGAASLPMGKEVRLQHIEFCKAFSALLPNGEFKGTIYLTAYNNPIPEADIPSLLKIPLGIDAKAKAMTISMEEVRGAVTMEMVKR